MATQNMGFNLISAAMKNRSLLPSFICIAALNVSAQPSQRFDDQINTRSCQYNGKSYAVGSNITTQDTALLACKTYDAIIPKTADRLEKGYVYWEKQMPVNTAGIELPRILFGTSSPSL